MKNYGQLTEPVIIKLYSFKKKEVYSDKMLVAFHKESAKVVAYGAAAEEYIRHPQPDITVASPTAQGIIWEYMVFERCVSHMLQEFLGRRGMIIKPRILLCLPGDIPMSEVSLKAYMDALFQAGARSVDFTEEAFDQVIEAPTPTHDLVIGIIIEHKEAVLREQIAMMMAYAEKNRISRETVERMLEEVWPIH